MFNKDKLEQIIRVNHAGEYGAKRIYEGQIAFTKDPKALKLIKEMYMGELEHLEYFEEEIKKRKIRPTILYPFWHVAGFSLGAITALMGKKAAMTCTYAVESVIDNHYKRQLEILPKEEAKLKAKIKKFREEEIEHKNIAETNHAKEALGFKILNDLITRGSKLSIWLAERF